MKIMVASLALSLTVTVNVNPPSSLLHLLPLLSSSSSSATASGVRFKHSLVVEKAERRLASTSKHICRAAATEYKFPDPIPEFADAETEKFRNHLLTKLSKRDIYGDSVDQVVRICTEIFGTFLHTEYGGPGTLLVLPFIDMADTVNERGLPGGPQAARAAVKWAQKHVDKDWNEWTGGDDE
nr:protein PLASTID REDOX INSENSITIVE 2, chloroplastic-like [Ziziphus jujuba var. spinosa]